MFSIDSKFVFSKEITFTFAFAKYLKFAQYILNTNNAFIKFKYCKTYITIFSKI